MAYLDRVRSRTMLAGYRRVSFVGGRKVLRSPEDQALEIENWAAGHGHRVHMLNPELDAKGSDASRPIFREAVEGVKSGRFTGIVVAYLSRAGRDLRLMLDLWDEIEAVGGVVYSARENVDGSTPAGRLQRNLLASINQHELEERAAGFEQARAASVDRGIWQRRQTPTGYRRNPDTRRLEVTDAGKVQEAARDVLAGVPVMEVARRTGMTANGLRYMLRNRVYLGELRVGEHVNTEAHDAILDPETFAALTSRLTGPKRPPARDPALLAGLVRCAACGHVMSRSRHSAKGSNYVCGRNHSGGQCPDPTAISCRKLEPVIDALAERELDRLEVEYGQAGEGDALRQATLEARAELAAYLRAVDAAGLGPEAAEGMRQRRERVLEAEAAEQAALSRSALPGLEGGAAAYRSLDVNGRNHVLRGLVAAVVVRRAGRGNPPLAGRVRVLRFGAVTPDWSAAGEVPLGIRPFWPEPDSDDVLRIPGGE